MNELVKGHAPRCIPAKKGFSELGQCACGADIRVCKDCDRACSDGSSWGFGLCQCGKFRSDGPFAPVTSQGKGADHG